MNTPPASVVMFVGAALFGAVGQYLYKSGAERATGSLATYLLNLDFAGLSNQRGDCRKIADVTEVAVRALAESEAAKAG